ncbi:MAG: hypothetical protein EXR93_08710 [Gemmatimonadetes bacterium]|nr:hypothetical protein [Gemmatimonadota bacterium]
MLRHKFLIMRCPACQQSNPNEAQFCLHCGAAIETAAPATAGRDPQRAALERALGAQFEIVRLLGRGRMGAVYLARERALERAVAIKVMPSEMATDAESRERFRREARTAAKLTHPNIVPLHTFGDVEGMLYFVMGYVRGESLGQRMHREGKLPPDDVRRIIGELAGSLDYAHRQGVIHRDIKPDNVLLDDESGRPMLTDFGVAKARASGTTLTEAGAVVGTPHYMSPEQAGGARDLDGRSDLYSLGIMAYAMLAGRLPFEGDSFRDVIVQHVTKAPPSLKALVPDVPAELEAAVSRALVKEPAARWPDGRTMALALSETDSDDEDSAVRKLSLRGNGLFVGGMVAASAVIALLSRILLFMQTPGRSGQPAPWLGICLVLGGVPAVAAGAIALLERARGEPWKDIIAQFMLPPRWWNLWWPKLWRRRGDVWHRLPTPVRRARWWYGASILIFGATAIVIVIVFDRWVHEIVPPRWLTTALLAGSFAYMGCFFATVIQLRAWGRAAGLVGAGPVKIGLAPTGQLDIWRKPKYAAVLLPPAGVAASAGLEPKAPEDYIRAILERTRDLTGRARDLGSEAVASARHLLAALATLDAEIALLARDASPVEIAALERRLVAPRVATGAHHPARPAHAPCRPTRRGDETEGSPRGAPAHAVAPGGQSPSRNCA